MTNVEKMREEFEISFAAQTACMLPEGEDVSRKDFATILLAAMVDDRKGDSYGTDLYKVGWWAWQASREAVVVDLPAIRPEPVLTGEALKADGEAATWSMWAGEKLAKEDCRAAIEAQGLRVGMKS